MKTFIIFGHLLFIKLQFHIHIAANNEINIDKEKPKKSNKCVKANTNGIANFKESLDCTTYVDKTMMIAEYFQNRVSQYNLVTCPHKFGKSTNLDMMRRFVQGGVKFKSEWHVLTSQKDVDQTSYNIFHQPGRKLKITPLLTNSQEFYEYNYQQYSTIYVSFKVTGVKTYEELIQALWRNYISCFHQYEAFYSYLSDTYRPYSSWFERLGDCLRATEVMERAFRQWGPYEEDVEDGLYQLCKLLRKFYPYPQLFLFIDDYDDPIVQAMENNFNVTRVVNLIDNIFSTLFNVDDRHFHHALITGTLNIIDTNKFDFINHWDFLNTHNFMKYFGFTENEVDELLDRHEVSRNNKEIVKRFYDGYNVSRSSMRIYNPYSITSYLSNKSLNNTPINLQSYWAEKCPISNFWKCFQENEVYRELAHNLLALEKVNFSLVERWSRDDLKELTALIHEKNFQLATNRGIDLMFSYMFHHGFFSYSDVKNMYRVPDNEDIKSCFKFLRIRNNFTMLNKSNFMKRKSYSL